MPVVPNMVQGEDGESFFRERTPEEMEGTLCAPLLAYDLGAEMSRFPKSREDEVRKWADRWYASTAQQKRFELRCGKHLRKLWKPGQDFRTFVERALKGETVFSFGEAQVFGVHVLSLISHHHWKELAVIADAAKAAMESLELDSGPSADTKVLTLNSFIALSRTGSLPTKAAVKARVKESRETVTETNFSQVFRTVGLDGLPEEKRGKKPNPRKRKGG